MITFLPPRALLRKECTRRWIDWKTEELHRTPKEECINLSVIELTDLHIYEVVMSSVEVEFGKYCSIAVKKELLPENVISRDKLTSDVDGNHYHFIYCLNNLYMMEEITDLITCVAKNRKKKVL